MKIKWLHRSVALNGPHVCLCLTEKEYKKAMKHLKAEAGGKWISNGWSQATTHLLRSKNLELCAVVCLRDFELRSIAEVHGLLCHEAVHIWQEHRDHMGERIPGSEQEAYAIQALATRLMAEYQRRCKS